jgi:hypothetical protein
LKLSKAARNSRVESTRPALSWRRLLIGVGV